LIVIGVVYAAMMVFHAYQLFVIYALISVDDGDGVNDLYEKIDFHFLEMGAFTLISFFVIAILFWWQRRFQIRHNGTPA
jgi:hypothetical protein